MKRRAPVLLVLCAAACAAAAPASAQDEAGPSLRLTLDQAVERAVAASPRLARLAALEAAASAQRRGARAERLPQVDLSLGYTRRAEVPELTLSVPGPDAGQPPRSITVFPNLPDNSRLRAGAALPLYTGGRVESAIAAATYSVEAAQQDLRGGRADLVLETKTAYWSLVTAREALRVLGESLRSYDAHLRDAQNRERFGLAARNEVLAVQVERDRAELERLRALAGAEIAEANLRRLLDLPPATLVETSEPLAGAAPAPADVEALVAQATASRPERQAQAARTRGARAAIGVERGSRRPQLALSGGFTYANPNRDIVPPTAEWKDTWDVGLGVSWNVLDFGRRSAAEARARAQADALDAQLRELDRAIRLEVTQRALELRTAEARVAVAARSVESAAENRRVAGDRYREGVIPSAELLDAELAQERAALAHAEALATLRIAAAGLDRAVGR